jgi:phosphoribosylanthranilate isomerase
MPSIRIKICGVTTPEDACYAVSAGADAIGLNFYPQSPRFLSPPRAAEIVRRLPAFAVPVGVFVGMTMRQACSISFQLGLRGVQTYSDDPPGDDPFPFAHIPAFRVQGSADLQRIRRYVELTTNASCPPAAVLIDSHVAGQMGGTGHPLPWSMLAEFDPGVPVILAGGLTSENVAEAISIVRPWGVDVASGVEFSPGRKDPLKVKRFIEAARSASG